MAGWFCGDYEAQGELRDHTYAKKVTHVHLDLGLGISLSHRGHDESTWLPACGALWLRGARR